MREARRHGDGARGGGGAARGGARLAGARLDGGGDDDAAGPDPGTNGDTTTTSAPSAEPVRGGTLVYDLPIIEGDAPTIYVSAVAYLPVNGERDLPAYATATGKLNVDPAATRLNVVVEASSVLNPPRGEVTFDLTVTDAEGRTNSQTQQVSVVQPVEAVVTQDMAQRPEAEPGRSVG